jgi:glycosyltransferase involved in cell wall biosynthesis
MSDQSPRVSIIVPAYNNADYTFETVESILAQTYTDYEVLVVDDGSTDHTCDVLRQFGNRIKYVYKENGGACSARNLGIEMSRGEFIACLDCDDLWLPEKLAHSIATFDENPEAAFVYTGCYLIDAEGKVVGQVRNLCEASEKSYSAVLGNSAIPAPTVVIRKSCLDKVGLFDECIFIPADWDLWLRLSREYPICYVDHVLSKYRLASNFTMKHISLSLDEHMYVLDKQFDGNTMFANRDKDHYRQQVLYMHAMMYRKNGDADNARRLLGRALLEYTTTGVRWAISMGLNWLISLLGIRVWTGVAKLRLKALGENRDY